jgi:N-acetylglucosaminyldiphosphoundecaprenol N-acetyl-beta-D-mannosaminyltransferase
MADYALGKPARTRFLGTPFDIIAPEDALEEIVQSAELGAPFRYVVTPNAAHVASLDRYPAQLGPVYRGSWMSLCDSRVLRHLARIEDLDLPLVTGSDLVAALFRGGHLAGKSITIVGSTPDVVGRVRSDYPAGPICQYIPPFGFIRDAVELRRCIEFIEDHPSHYLLLAVGAPQSEMLAHHLATATARSGICLCVGASLDFLVGAKTRAPKWMQAAMLEWLFRLLSEPARLWRRYLLRSPRIFKLVLRDILKIDEGPSIQEVAFWFEGARSDG